MKEDRFEQKYHWSYQCNRCFLMAGYGFTGYTMEAQENAPGCCGGEKMQAVRGNKVKE